jgi:hypothetical protein
LSTNVWTRVWPAAAIGAVACDQSCPAAQTSELQLVGVRVVDGMPSQRVGSGYFHLKWTKIRPKLSESFSTR